MRGASENDKTLLIFNSRWIPEKGDSGQAYFSLRGLVHPNITMGADYRPLSDDVGFLATWRLLSETEKRPALIVGTSHDDFVDGDEEIDSQTLYASISKYAFAAGPVDVSPYVGGVWIFELDEARPLGGVSLRLDNYSAIVQYSGTDTHLTLGRDMDRMRLSYVYWGLKYHGLAGTWRF